MAMKAKTRGWLVTIVTLVATAILAINNQEKVKEWAQKVPFIANLLK